MAPEGRAGGEERGKERRGGKGREMRVAKSPLPPSKKS